MTPFLTRFMTRRFCRLTDGVLRMVLVGLFVTTAAGMAVAGPVEWREVPASEAGRQWWDAGSVRLNRSGSLSVLSRFQPSGEGERPPAPLLYVMELDCDQELYRDTSVNGIPRWGAEWQASGDDDLTAEVVRAVCASAAGDRPA